eukprot:SAG31_NODE_43194_length_268_cov_0.609467_2_plen_25_part_01
MLLRDVAQELFATELEQLIHVILSR